MLRHPPPRWPLHHPLRPTPRKGLTTDHIRHPRRVNHRRRARDHRSIFTNIPPRICSVCLHLSSLRLPLRTTTFRPNLHLIPTLLTIPIQTSQSSSSVPSGVLSQMPPATHSPPLHLHCPSMLETSPQSPSKHTFSASSNTVPQRIKYFSPSSYTSTGWHG